MSCAICSFTPTTEPIALLLTQTVTIGKRVVSWLICLSCWKARMAEMQAEQSMRVA